MGGVKTRIKFMVFDPETNKLIKPTTKKYYFCTGLDCKAAKYVIWQDCLVAPAIEGVQVFQFTGRKDSKRKEIYEGHIVKTELGESVVIYNPKCAAFQFVNDGLFSRYLYDLPKCEVIGHISVNPEKVEWFNLEDWL